MKVVSAEEMRAIDRATSERFGVPSLELMENAGKAVEEFICTRYPAATRITVFCGKGNNGGDGFVAARRLHGHGKRVEVILLAAPSDLRADAAVMFGRLPFSAIPVRSNEQLENEAVIQALNADLYIDAILGTGFKPPVSGLYAEAIRRLNEGHVPVVAVDISSGADADAMQEEHTNRVRADAIVTFTAPRPAHVFAALTNGPTIIVPIGSPDEAIFSGLQLNVTTPGDFATLIAPRAADSNKGDFGHVLVIGGSLGKAGAAAMAGISTLRIGAGLATIATAKSILATVAGFHPEIMTEPLPETEAGTIALAALDQIEKLTEGKTVLAIGPGISRNPQTEELVRSLIAKTHLPTVLDADGLNAFAGRANELNGKRRTLVITPHPGEMARLVGCGVAEVQKDRLNIARKFAREHDLIVVLKGHRTLVVRADGEAWVNTTGNPGMATGGTGDILTGMTAGMLAQSPKNTFTAVTAAVYLHGLAGDVMRGKLGEHSLIATDLLAGLPEAFRCARAGAQERTVEL
jgi:ADP-dependent NAD(P)H-hydrate dehydratase / NAD(P)H-hydrate epimerase